LLWGNNVFTYDRALLIRSSGTISRALEQFGAIVQGVYPRIHILSVAENAPQVATLVRLRLHVLVVGLLVCVALLALMAGLIGGWCTAESGRRKETP
jgi:hypothetical protein